ncbi:SGNH/GDSL hydrolase family protein [Arthrobacter sp. B1805]|uniref:SGNH/GDSL hydrolase family protein n=1 Tax=Arthrobacter sp. B1805 TaxID=2058892 RepID=UPI0015E4670C|nr:SGNH/GDSL hydrolase family protein [Arthrobacter sp. B1805]
MACLGTAVVLTFTGLNLANRESLAENAAAAEAYNAKVTTPAIATSPATGTATSSPAPQTSEQVSLDGASIISVLGDSTGNSSGEWVDLWAQDLAKNATVTVHMWDQLKQQYYSQPKVYGTAEKQITIWNGSMSGASADYPVDKLSVIQPETPDIVLLSFGHNGTPQNIGPAFQATYDAIASAAPEAETSVIIQNPANPPRTERTDENQAAVKQWAGTNGLPTLDVRSAFDTKPDLTALLLDDGTGVHPNDAGSRVWADAIITALR